MLYGDDIYVGYRYYDTVDLPVQFPFGHGLSYTKFTLSNLQISVEDKVLLIQAQLANVGSREGSEVVQAYITQKTPSLARPAKELIGFAKFTVKPDETVDVRIDVPLKYATSYWDEGVGKWTSDAGSYTVLVGNSSRAVDFLEGVFETAKAYSWSGI